MISGAILVEMRLRKIDETHLTLHAHVSRDDTCYFLYERTSGRNYAFSEANQLISNLKKPLSVKSTKQWKHKKRAITRCAKEFGKALNDDWLEQATLVPIPPSKAKDHAEYDDRICQICQGVGTGVDVRELVFQSETTRPSHEAGANRLTVEELVTVYKIDELLCDPPPKIIGIVDDVLTAGTHFRAMSEVLSARFPTTNIVGLFVARRIFPDDDELLDDLDELDE